jgi:nicotinate-nucleotide adenylyltransferase
MKIGIFGGSFNPIHIGHTDIIKKILNKKLVDKVWIMPCKKHAFKKNLINKDDRIKMIKLAIKKITEVTICYIEVKSRRKSYTADTLKILKSKYKHRFWIIIGSDLLYEIEKWHKSKELLKEAEFIVLERKNYPLKKIGGLKILKTIKDNKCSISSTQIRKKIKEGKSIKNLVPIEVEKYIKKNKLYQ